MGNETEESLLTRYQIGSETSMEGSDFASDIFDESITNVKTE